MKVIINEEVENNWDVLNSTLTVISDFLVGDYPNIVNGESNASSGLMVFQAAKVTQNVIENEGRMRQ